MRVPLYLFSLENVPAERMQPSLEVRISRGLGICPNKSFDEIGAGAEISKTSIPGQECPCLRICVAMKISYLFQQNASKENLVLYYGK